METTKGYSDGLQGEIVLSTGAPTETMHTHVADPVSPQKRERITKLKEAATDNRATPSSSIVATAHEGLDEQALQRFPSQRALQQSVNKIEYGKRADLKPEQLEFPEPLKRTIRGDQFLRVDSRVAEPDKPIFFSWASDHGIELLKEHKEWGIDGTFFSAPKYMDSLLTINVIIGKSSLPAAYFLLSDRKQVNYTRAFEAFFALPECQGIAPNSYLTDFELGLANSLAALFPDADQQFCHFHFSKAVFTNVQKHGLLRLYDSPEVKILLRSFSSLALLPIDEVYSGFDDICAELTKSVQNKTIPRSYVKFLNKFVQYFESTYLGRKMPGGRRGAPRFPVSSWNCNRRTIDESPRTNNAQEGWHAYLNAQFSRSNLPMTQFLIRIQKEEERMVCLGTRHNANPAEHLRGRPAGHDVRLRNLQVHVEQYAAKPPEERNRIEFLRFVQYHLSPVAFARLIADQEKENGGDAGSACSSQQTIASESSDDEDPDLPSQSQEPSSNHAMAPFDFGV
ncbi:hypothetical protein AAVH_14788 [Aphelenchoides avenae]|nr:hypothetical protein AAVH_14788 [Aphelenchus avenae]